MGGGSSKSENTVTVEENTVIVNKTNMDFLNEEINNLMTETILNNAKNCSASLYNKQDFIVDGVTARGDINIMDINQVQQSNVNLSCIQENQTVNDVGMAAMSELYNQIDNNVSADLISQMDSQLAQESEKQSMSFDFGSSETNNEINQIRDYHINNEKDINLRNVMHNEFMNKFTQSDLQECVAKTNNSQTAEFTDLVSTDGGVNIKTISQTQAAELMNQCIQNNETTTQVITDVMKKAGYELKVHDDTAVSTEATASLDAKSLQTGAISDTGGAISEAAQGIGQGIANIYSPFTEMFGNMANLVAGAMCFICCICCIGVILALVGVFSSEDNRNAMSNMAQEKGFKIPAMPSMWKGSNNGPGNRPGMMPNMT